MLDRLGYKMKLPFPGGSVIVEKFIISAEAFTVIVAFLQIIAHAFKM